eukprot:SAG31_NODE_3908_length_3763_cov_2.736627_1_plen_190_part_10
MSLTTDAFHVYRPQWRAGWRYGEGDRIYPEQHQDFFYRCIRRGTSGDAEPHWDSLSDKVDDASVQWQREGNVFTPTDRPWDGMTVEEQNRLCWAASSENVLVFGIIDILARYEFKKKAQHRFFGSLLCQSNAVSPQPAHQYGRRFLQFVREEMGAGFSLDGDRARDGEGLKGIQRFFSAIDSTRSGKWSF